MPKDKITVQKTAKEIKDATIKAGNYVATKTKQLFTPTNYKGLDNPEDAEGETMKDAGKAKPTFKERIFFAGGAAAYATKCTFNQLKSKISKKKTDSSIKDDNPTHMD